MSVAAIDDKTTIPGEYAGGDVPTPYAEDVPEGLRRATGRLQFPPSYVVVGFYRLVTDKNLRGAAWQKCKHGFVRGASVGLLWAAGTYKIQKIFVEYFLINSPRVTGLSRDGLFGISMPFDVPTYATLFFLSSQVSAIIYFFLSRNIRIARERAYEQTIQSRGKGPDWWRPYVEEWDNPPKVVKVSWGWRVFMSGPVGRIVAKVIAFPLHFVPFAGMFIVAWFRALGTARYLHEPYYKAKHMTPEQIAVFIEERKWDYRAFGFAAALAERMPIVGLIFSISNRVGAAMWAHDLEKRQHYVAAVKAGLAPGAYDSSMSVKPKVD
ncbi:hypothetical protein K466DRAFT_659724 [Polyporus arcularius HHB13444]|uniref:Uncharacterized protein n=1 Tax=Polyporus arcularius HHB13444 TaxID=1314778 RepID=A0A5C3PRQ6_9APHY|nr:hypothetical protein K466DRAFT_659724 [Polyporus arcularius HHB13444]